MRHPDLLERSHHADIAAPREPLRAILQAPLEPPGALIELADQDEQFIGRGICALVEVRNIYGDRLGNGHDLLLPQIGWLKRVSGTRPQGTRTLRLRCQHLLLPTCQ